MQASWLSKPLTALSTEERFLFSERMQSSLPLSQTLEWGRAIPTSEGVPYLVFSPERSISGLFLISGDHAECINGPVLNWELIRCAPDLNEQVSRVVFALHQGNPNLQKVLIRPRLSQEHFEFLNSSIAFPIDSVNHSCTLILDLDSDETRQWQRMPARIRGEISRSMREGVVVHSESDSSGVSEFWEKASAFYKSKGLFIPDENWIRALLGPPSGASLSARIFTVFHPGSDSEAGMMLLVNGKCAYYFYAYEKRNPSCPNISLNAILQWEAIRFCLNIGVVHYDLNGALPNTGGDESFRGVDFYKRRFKGREVNYFSPLIRFQGA